MTARLFLTLLCLGCGSPSPAERPTPKRIVLGDGPCIGELRRGLGCRSPTNDPPSGIRGSLVDATGQPAADVRLVFVGAKTGKRFAVKSDRAGVFELVQLPRDDYDVRTSSPRGTLLRRVTFSATRWVHVDLVLPR